MLILFHFYLVFLVRRHHHHHQPPPPPLLYYKHVLVQVECEVGEVERRREWLECERCRNRDRCAALSDITRCLQHQAQLCVHYQRHLLDTAITRRGLRALRPCPRGKGTHVAAARPVMNWLHLQRHCDVTATRPQRDSASAIRRTEVARRSNRSLVAVVTNS